MIFPPSVPQTPAHAAHQPFLDSSDPQTVSHGRWINSPAWTLMEQKHNGRTLLVLTAGSDESYIVDEASTDAIAQHVLHAWQAGKLAALLNDADCGAAARQIQRVGALMPQQVTQHNKSYTIAWLGSPWTELELALDTLQHAGMPRRTHAAESAELVLVVRTNAGWQDALSQYQQLGPSVPHLFIDTAYHHTIGIGPYVVPGETACIGCLGNRVAHRWGDLKLPDQPASASQPLLLASLLAPLLAAASGLIPFVEHSISLNLQTLSSTRDKVFQLPWCPSCRSLHDKQQRDQLPHGESQGSLDLPWLSGTVPHQP